MWKNRVVAQNFETQGIYRFRDLVLKLYKNSIRGPKRRIYSDHGIHRGRLLVLREIRPEVGFPGDQ